MTETTLQLAQRVSFEIFVNCYLQELGVGRWHSTDDWSRLVDTDWPGRGPFVVEFALSHRGIRVALDVVYRSQVGCHGIGKARLLQPNAVIWQFGDELYIILALVRELYSAPGVVECQARAQELELILRVIQSVQVLAGYLGSKDFGGCLSTERFIDSEQALLFGHWRHPTPKSRQGMNEWQHESSAPELHGRFRLHFFSVARTLISQDSALKQSAEELVAGTLDTDERSRAELAMAKLRGEVLIPVHPLQSDWLLHQPQVQRWLKEGLVREVGRLGCWFTATSSVRTVYNEHCDWMFKLSIPVKITNSLRFNRRRELFAGVAMARLIEKLGPNATRIEIIADPAYLTVEAPEELESGFELVIRANPFKSGREFGVHCVASITQRALPQTVSRLRTLIEGLALTEARNVETVSLEWLVRYMKCAIEPLIRLYDEHGVALEAHQQNSLLDLSAGYPMRYIYRDNQGFYLSARQRERLEAIEPGLALRPELFFDDALIQQRLSYYLIQNQLFSVVHRLGCDGLLEEDLALSVVRTRLSTLEGRLDSSGKSFVNALLRDRTLLYKANLLTRVHDMDELTVENEEAVYVAVENPFCRSAFMSEQEPRVA